MKQIVIAGPTASGKTELALGLASVLDKDIISSDSRQVYKYLTAGTAKPEGVWKDGVYKVNGVPYHLVDFLEPRETFNAGAFCAAAAQKSGIICGGTGLYIEALFFGLNDLPKDENLRRGLCALSKADLHSRLKAVDPVSAAEIPEGNIQRTMRALEIFLITKTPASVLRTKKSEEKSFKDKAFFVYLNPEREVLNRRIEERTKKIFEPMCAEADALLSKGVPEDAPALKSLGYPEAIAYIKGNIKKADALEKIITLTRQYAKRQRTWFNRYKDVHEVQTPDVDKILKKLPC